MLDDMLAKKGVSVDKVLDFQIPDQVLVERIEGQGVEPSFVVPCFQRDASRPPISDRIHHARTPRLNPSIERTTHPCE